MVKEVFVAVVLLFMVSTALAADNAAPTAPKFPGFPGLPSLPFPGRRASPPLPHLPFPGHGAIPSIPHFPFPGLRASPPPPSGQKNPPSLPKPDPKFDKCFQDFNIGQGCVQQVMTSFFSHKFNVDAACCQAIQKVVDDCVSAVFGQFNNPFFGPLLKQFCSSGPSPPKA